jgi:succinate-semialdehyde dehydrogenase/glutarate-semialdehyde dehydrogenase
MYESSLWINGRAIEETAAARIDVVNPATEEILGTAPTAGAAEVAAAVEAAQHGFGVWSRTTPWERATVLRRIAALIRERTEELVTLITLEIGKTRVESRIEVTAATEYFDWAAEEARRLGGYFRSGRTAGSRFEVDHEPVGIVLALAAWNYPVILASRKLAMSLAAGCSVILRPAEEAPGCVSALIRCLHDAGVPAGVVNLLVGSPSEVVEPLMANPLVRKVSFTGSTRVGQLLIAQSALTVKRLTLELGGHAPFIVLADADVEKAASMAVTARMRCAGQVCTAPSRFYVDRSIGEAFTERVTALSRALKVGNGMNEGVQMGPLATRRQQERAVRLVTDARNRGAHVTCGGGRPSGLDAGYFFEPTVLTHVPEDAAILHEEPFTPIAAIVTVENSEEAVRRANAVEFGLAAYVFGRSRDAIERVTSTLQAGVVGVNTIVVTVAEMPFGGVQQSGYGREGGVESIRDFLNTKFVHHAPG